MTCEWTEEDVGIPEQLLARFGAIRDKLRAARKRLELTAEEARELNASSEKLKEMATHSWRLRKEAYTLQKKAEKLVKEGQQARDDRKMVEDLLLEEIGEVEVAREWTETRFAGTSNSFRERFKEHDTPGFVEIQLPFELQSVPRSISCVALDDDREDVDLLFELESVRTRREVGETPRVFATYSVEVL